VIRSMSDADLPAIGALLAASQLLVRYRVTPENAPHVVSMVGEADLALVNDDDAGPNAFAWVSFAPSVLNGAAYLRLLLIADNAQHRGIGSALLQAVERHARERANHMYLLATSDNSGARRFYERHGYRHVGDLPGLVWPDLDEALYYKTLRPYADRLG
jgi:GNAT superfamily N-acetyltransferase